MSEHSHVQSTRARFLALAREERAACDSAEQSPGGAVLARGDELISTGRTRRVELSDPIRYAVMDCLSNAGRRTDQATLTLYVSGSFNWLDAGTIVQFGVGSVVLDSIDRSAAPDAEATPPADTAGMHEFLLREGVKLVLLDSDSDSDAD